MSSITTHPEPVNSETCPCGSPDCALPPALRALAANVHNRIINHHALSRCPMTWPALRGVLLRQRLPIVDAQAVAAHLVEAGLLDRRDDGGGDVCWMPPMWREGGQ